MRKLMLLLLLASCVWISPALAKNNQAAARGQVNLRLAQGCINVFATVKDKVTLDDTYWVGHCVGMVAEAGYLLKTFDQICGYSGTIDDGVKAVIEYITQNPSTFSEDPSVNVVIALEKKYPCGVR